MNDWATMTINPLRINCRNQVSEAPGAVVYWMSRDQRVADNWALLHAQNLALERRLPLAVVFTLADSFLGATLRHFGFMLRGLAGVAERLQELGIAFVLLRGNPPDEMCRFIQQHKVGALVTDFDPLRIKRSWHDQVAGSVPIPCVEVRCQWEEFPRNLVMCEYRELPSCKRRLQRMQRTQDLEVHSFQQRCLSQ